MKDTEQEKNRKFLEKKMKKQQNDAKIEAVS